MRRNEKGTQIAELAVVLPLVVFLALIAGEGVGIVRAHQVIVNAAREGARIAVLEESKALVEDSTKTFIKDMATCYMVRNGLTPTASLPSSCSSGVDVSHLNCETYSATVDTSVSFNGGSMPGLKVQVTCGYRLSYLPNLSWFGVPSTVPLGASVVWRRFW